jgi:hypothetical protein
MTGPIRGDVRMRVAESRHASVVQEIAQETAAALGRAGGRVQRALEAVRELDRSGSAPAAGREEILDEAGEALYFYVVQREACGLRDTHALLDELGVPHAVRLRMTRRPPRGADRARD